MGKLTVYMTSQAPHIIRAAVAIVAELPEHMIRIVAPDLGGGFGNKVPVYPGYVASILASILLERPVKWIEDKTGNLISTADPLGDPLAVGHVHDARRHRSHFSLESLRLVRDHL